MKYDNSKWKLINSTHDMFKQYVPVLQFEDKTDEIVSQHVTLYGQPSDTRKSAYTWILENLPKVEKVDIHNSTHSPENFEPNLYVLHAGESHGAKPSQIKPGMLDADGNDWLEEQDSRSVISKKIDHYFWKKIINFLK